MRPVMVVALLTLVSCRQIFGLEPPVHHGTDAPIDSELTVDAGTCVASSVECVTPSVLRTCDGPGVAAYDTSCAWGCKPNAPAHCGQLVPSGAAASADDTVVSPDLVAVLLTGNIVIDGDDGKIGTLAMPSSIRGAGTNVINGIDYKVINNAAVFRFKKLTIAGPVSIIGTHAIVLISDEDLAVSDLIDLRGPCLANVATAGGAAGGPRAVTAAGSGGGAGGPTDANGGGGGGHGSVGARGGTTNGAGALGGPIFGDATITKLGGGGGGGGGGDTLSGSVGGAGGGAIQLISNAAITIASTGAINAGGCGGRSATNGAGGGGGAGGTILLEAHTVVINGKLAANGGGGGGGDTGAGPGESGGLTRSAAIGSSGGADGGGGGAGAAGGNAAASGQNAMHGGGGGGGIGRIRVNSLTGTATVGGGVVMSPAFTDGTGSQGSVVIQ